MSAQPVDVLCSRFRTLDEKLASAIEAAEHHEKLASLRECHGHVSIAYAAQCGLREARAAVAELIEAAKFARLTGNGPMGYTPGADRRLAAALARVGGAA